MSSMKRQRTGVSAQHRDRLEDTMLDAGRNYFLRLYDSSSPPLYSRYPAALQVDYPL